MKTFCLLLLLSVSCLGETLRGVVVRVQDGDTLTLKIEGQQQQKIRLSGIDAPELGQPYGKTAREKLSELVLDKSVVVIWSKRDRYGRLLGTVCLGSENINLKLLSDGAAWFFRRYAANVPEIEQYLYEAAEGEAKERKAGLWQQQQVAPWEWRQSRRQRRVRKMETVINQRSQ